MKTSISPVILGRGMSGQAMLQAFSLIQSLPSWAESIERPKFLERGQLPSADTFSGEALLCISNPHGLHASTLLEADEQGYRWIVVDKPVCTTVTELGLLSKIRAKVWVGHGYRQFWGPQTIRKWVTEGKLGRLISIEGRYWQSSAAQKALEPNLRKTSWKNDLKLSGGQDVVLDLATHWLDLAGYLCDAAPESIRGWRSFINSEAAHRDTHVHLSVRFSELLRGFVSVSKTVHGAGNSLVIQVLGEKGAASWSFENPDRIYFSRGSKSQEILRTSPDELGLGAFHGTGWVSGYASILLAALSAALGRPERDAPTLEQAISMMRSVLAIQWEG